MRIALLGLLVMSGCMSEIMAQSSYRLPPPEVAAIIDAKPEPSVIFSPDSEWMVFLERDAMPTIGDLSRRMLKLAGVRIDPQANSTFQSEFFRGIQLRRRAGGEMTTIPLPADVRIGSLQWSHHSNAFAFTQLTDRGTELWKVNLENPTDPQLVTDRLATVIAEWDWLPDGVSILAPTVPSLRGPEPPPPAAPSGPTIEESLGNKSPTRTLQDLLTSPYDESLFEYYATTQLMLFAQDGTSREVGTPGMFEAISISPDGTCILVSMIERPFSYTLAYSSFPHTIAVWNWKGEPIATIAKVPMEENIPIEGVRTGPRRVHWRASWPAQLIWTEALDGGDPKRKVEFRERIMSQAFPFEAEPKELLKLAHRYSGISYFANPNRLLASELDRDRRWTTTHLVDFSGPSPVARVVIDRSIRDQYGDPGRLAMTSDQSGYAIAIESDDSVFMAGMGATPDGYRPFLDRRNLSTDETTRIWRCPDGCLESVVTVKPGTGDGAGIFITRHESPDSPPNYMEWSLTGDKRTPLTDFRDPTPSIRSIQKSIVKYERADGVPLSATMYLPADYKPGTRLPLLIWAYPLEFSDAATAGQVTTSPYQFTRMSGISHLTLVTQGYCVMDSATMPVVGDPDTMNDTFVPQIVASAQAAIDKAVEMGVADRDRVAVGGHSYGAFMAANLLAHSDLFRAAIARSGAYNRTLTPFGFQAERRPLWEAKEVYLNLSPFLHADQIKRPILLIHGENDNNPGTFPIQSQRLFQAIRGNGGFARLVMLPFEGHGYRARESVLHVQAEMIEWLNRYVRDAEAAVAQAE